MIATLIAHPDLMQSPRRHVDPRPGAEGLLGRVFILWVRDSERTPADQVCRET